MIKWVIILYHATSVAIAYGVVILFFYGILRELSFFVMKCSKSLKINVGDRGNETREKYLWFIKPVLVVLLVCYITWNILLYFFLPIDTAFDDATNHFIAIYQRAVIFFTAVITYFLIYKPFRSYVSIFTQAEKNNNILWKENEKKLSKSNKDNDITIAAEILKVLKLQKDFYTKQKNTENPQVDNQ